MKTIDTAEFKELRNDATTKVTLLDVLPESNHRQKHIAGAKSAPLESDDFLDRVRELVDDKQQPVVVACANPSCDTSPTAARRLEDEGYENVYDYEGGVEAWEDAGEPLEGENVAVR